MSIDVRWTLRREFVTQKKNKKLHTSPWPSPSHLCSSSVFILFFPHLVSDPLSSNRCPSHASHAPLHFKVTYNEYILMSTMVNGTNYCIGGLAYPTTIMPIPWSLLTHVISWINTMVYLRAYANFVFSHYLPYRYLRAYANFVKIRFLWIWMSDNGEALFILCGWGFYDSVKCNHCVFPWFNFKAMLCYKAM